MHANSQPFPIWSGNVSILNNLNVYAVLFYFYPELPAALVDLQGMWYPTVRRTLVCLSKLYRCISVSIPLYIILGDISYTLIDLTCFFTRERRLKVYHKKLCLFVLVLLRLPVRLLPRERLASSNCLSRKWLTLIIIVTCYCLIPFTWTFSTADSFLKVRSAPFKLT